MQVVIRANDGQEKVLTDDQIYRLLALNVTAMPASWGGHPYAVYLDLEAAQNSLCSAEDSTLAQQREDWERVFKIPVGPYQLFPNLTGVSLAEVLAVLLKE